jgi:hypothetical protein
MAHRAGGVEKLAQEFGVTRFAVWTWAHKVKTPSKLTQGAVNAWAFQRGIDPPFRSAPVPQAKATRGKASPR